MNLKLILKITEEQFDKAMDAINKTPSNSGKILGLILRVPPETKSTTEVKKHKFQTELKISKSGAVEGDKWLTHCVPKYGELSPKMQVSLINARVSRLISGSWERMGLSGDNIIVDLHLKHIDPGQKIRIGEVELVASDKDHNGCAIFQRRYGKTARSSVNVNDRVPLHLRGVYTTVVKEGTIHLTDTVELIN